MSQDWPSLTQQPLKDNVLTNLPDRIDSVATDWAGTTEPTTGVAAFHTWADTANDVVKRRNAANTDWDVIGPLATYTSPPILAHINGGIQATGSWPLIIPHANMLVYNVMLLSDTTTTGSVASTTEWVWDLKNQTTTNSLFSAVPTTATTQTGIGGGEVTANVAYVLNADQNALVTAGDRLTFDFTKTGSPTNMTNVWIALRCVMAD